MRPTTPSARDLISRATRSEFRTLMASVPWGAISDAFRVSQAGLAGFRDAPVLSELVTLPPRGSATRPSIDVAAVGDLE